MTFLSLHFYFNIKKGGRFGKLILLGLVFSIFGDVFLMFKANGGTGQLYFLLGLGSFLLTQLCYFLAFLSISSSTGYLKKKPWTVLFFLVFLIGNSAFLWPDLPAAFRIPVVLYSTVITLMAVSCFNLLELIPNAFFKYLFTGVLLFMISDTLIGLNQFKQGSFIIPKAGFLIMLTYIVAQYLIATGSINLINRENNS